MFFSNGQVNSNESNERSVMDNFLVTQDGVTGYDMDSYQVFSALSEKIEIFILRVVPGINELPPMERARENLAAMKLAEEMALALVKNCSELKRKIAYGRRLSDEQIENEAERLSLRAIHALTARRMYPTLALA